MKKINIQLIIVCFISLLFIFQLVSAITVNSSSYSVGKFSTGLVTSNSSSSSYESLLLSESGGTTRNGQSDSYTTNVGFFDNTPYYRAVSITSYSIYPKSSVQGSIIRLMVSALNSDRVWAVLTRPDSTQETIALSNNVNLYYTADQIGRYDVTLYANNSMGDLASVIDSFDITSPVNPPSGGGGGGGGITVITKECTFIWDCTSWSICLNGNQIRECKNNGNCEGIKGKPEETRKCSDALFDVAMQLNEVQVTQNKTLKFNINLTETKGIEKIDVQVKYSIINSNNTEIFSQIETKAVENNLTYDKDINDLKLPNGTYTLRIDIIYGNLQRAFAEQRFEVISEAIPKETQKEEHLVSFLERLNHSKIIILLALLIGIFILFVIFIRLRILKTRRAYAIENNLREGLELAGEGRIDEARDKYREIKKIYRSSEDKDKEIYHNISRFYEIINRIRK